MTTVMDPMLPDEVKFLLHRDSKDFNKFVAVWGSKYLEFEMDTVVENKDDENMVNVWLRRKKVEP